MKSRFVWSNIVMVDKVDFQSFRIEVGDLLVMIVLDLPLVRLFMV